MVIRKCVQPRMPHDIYLGPALQFHDLRESCWIIAQAVSYLTNV